MQKKQTWNFKIYLNQNFDRPNLKHYKVEILTWFVIKT